MPRAEEQLQLAQESKTITTAKHHNSRLPYAEQARPLLLSKYHNTLLPRSGASKTITIV